eukprot:2874937-Prymnesium_polylepis.1
MASRRLRSNGQGQMASRRHAGKWRACAERDAASIHCGRSPPSSQNGRRWPQMVSFAPWQRYPRRRGGRRRQAHW